MDPATPIPQQPLSKYTPPSDASRYIRTYAKDVAALTNQPPPETHVSQPSAPQADSATAAQQDTSTDGTGVSLPSFDPSPVNHAGDPSSPKEFTSEEVTLTSADSDGIFAGESPTPLGNDQVQTTPLMPQASIGVAPSIAPSGNTILEPEQQPAVEPEREAILARLRAKIAERKKEPELAPEPEAIPVHTTTELARPALPMPEEPLNLPPAEPIPTPEPEPEAIPVPEPLAEPALSSLRTAAPTFTQETEIVPPLPPVSRPPEPATAPTLHVETEGPSPLHTYSSDFAEHIDQKNSSTFSVLAAQSDAGQTPVPRSPRKKSFLPLVAGIAMLVVGVGAVLGAYFYIHQSPETPMVENVPSLIRFDESVPVQGSGQTLMDAIANVASGAHVSGNVVVTYITNASSTAPSAGTGIPQPGGALVRQLSLPAPAILLRNIADSSTVGVISAGSESRPFFLLKVSSYERTFAGMLAWERTMPSDLATFYPAYDSAPTVSASSTPLTADGISNAISEGFTDDVVNNYDVRVLRDGYGRSIMLYGYYGKDTLIIARDEASFTALVSRLSATGN